MMRRILIDVAVFVALLFFPAFAAASTPNTSASPNRRPEAKAQMLLAYARFGRDHDIPSAKNAMRDAATTDTSYAAPCLALGALCELEENWAEASSWYQKALSREPKGMAADEARAEIARAHAASISDQTAEGKVKRQKREKLAIARAAVAEGRPLDAIDAASEAHKLDPNAWEPFAVMAAALSEAGQNTRALSAMDAALKRCSEDKQKAQLTEARAEIEAEIHRTAALVDAANKLRAQQYASAAAAFEAVYQADSTRPDAWRAALAAAGAYRMAGSLYQALTIADAIEASPAALSGPDAARIHARIEQLRDDGAGSPTPAALSASMTVSTKANP